MRDGNWFGRGRGRSKVGKSKRGKAKRGRAAFASGDRGRLSFESLEDRRMLATYLVVNGGDLDNNGAVILGTLRWAVNASNATPNDNDTIVFADNVSTVSLNGGQLTLTDEVRILGPGPRKLTIQQTRANVRIFETNIGAADEAFPVEISGVTLSGGNIIGTGEDRKGGAIYNRESLRMVEVVIDGNSASRGGGGVYNHFGSLTIDRSLIINNTSNVGGGVMNGAEDQRPSTTITNSTITGNLATGGGGDQYPVGYGGGVFNRNGRLTITGNTITGNNAALGAGVGSWGNPLPDDPANPPPPQTVFTTISHSIIVGNDDSDVDRVGKSDDDPPADLLPSINLSPNPMIPFLSPGYNIIGTGNATVDGDPNQAFMDIALGGQDYLGLLVEDVLQVDFDPLLGYGGLDDYGGSTDVFLLAPNSVAIDGGAPNRSRDYDQRGRHFAGNYDYLQLGDPTIDIGAVEMQSGVFIVDTLVDEDDDIFSFINRTEIRFGVPTVFVGYYDVPGDFSLREALNFARKNPGLDTIRFSDMLFTEEVLVREDNDPDGSPAPTILLTMGALRIDDEVIIEGPTSFILEVDASGNDPTRNANEGNGSRVFVVDDFDPTNFINVSISNLTVKGADFNGEGGGIYTRENLTLRHMTFKDNSATNDGGAIFVKSGELIVDESTFKNNRASDDGGAVFVESGAGGPQTGATFNNSTFSANVAGDRGAGIYNNNSQVLVTFSTITLNNAGSTRAHGIANAGANALTTLWASIVSGNSPDENGNGGNDIEFVTVPPGATISGFNSLGHNLIGTGNAKNAFNQTGDVRDVLNPRLAPLTITGGLIETHRPIYDVNPALRSQAIDMGPDIFGITPLTPPTTDQRGEGFVRQAGLRSDVGAYEVQRMVLLVDTLLDENDGDTSVGNFSLREAIELANKNPTLPDQLPDLIEFDLTMLFGQDANSINLGVFGLQPLTPPDIKITDSLIIVGPGADLLAIDGTDLASFFIPQTAFFSKGSRMFTVDDGNGANFINVEISGLTFRNALAPQAGSAFWSRENLTFDQVAFLNNHTIDPDEAAFGQPPVDLQNLHGGALFQQQGKLTITNSLISGNTTMDAIAHGGAIYVVNGALDVRYSTIAGNAIEHSGHGGAIHVKGSSFLSIGNTISGNTTLGGVGDGGGFFSDASNVELRDTVVSSNVTQGANSEGGGFAATNSTVTLFDSVVSLNTTSGSQSHGGGVFASGGNVTLNRSIVSQNTASGQNSLGGGIAMTTATVTLNATTVDRNLVTALGGNGGGIANLGGTLVIRDSTVNANQAMHSQALGGGVYSDDLGLAGASDAHSTLIVNSTVSGNSAGLRGGGVFNVDGVTEILHSTITNNSTPFMNAGSGVASHGSSTTHTRFYSSIVAGNVGSVAGTGSDVDFVDGAAQNSVHSLGYNLIGTGNALAKFTAALNDQKNVLNPGLGVLANNGGPTRTHALLAGSPAIDRGDAAVQAAGDSAIFLLDDYAANNFAANYNFVNLAGNAQNSPQTVGGVARLSVGSGTGAFIWKQGHSLQTVGDRVSVDFGFNYPISPGGAATSAAGMALFGSVTGDSLFAELRVVTDKTNGGTIRRFLDGVSTTNLSGPPTGPMTLSITVTGKTSSTITIEYTLTGAGFTSITKSRTLDNVTQLFFGVTASDVVGAGVYHDNLQVNAPIPDFDQRGIGFTRVYNGDNAGTARIDVGAFELQGAGLAGDFSGDDVVDGTDFLVWQRNVSKTSPTPADGDLNNDDKVDGADLAGWGASFGAGSENVAAVAAVMVGGESFVEEAVASASSMSSAVEVSAIPATSIATTVASNAPATAAPSVAASFVGLGRPGAPAVDGVFAGFAKKADRQVAAAIAVLSREKPSWLSSDDDDAELSLLDEAASEEGERAEDAVFAAWDAPFGA